MNVSTQPVRPYAIVSRPGYFGNTTTVVSAHATLAAARKALGRSKSCQVVTRDSGFRKGETIYSDRYPTAC